MKKLILICIMMLISISLVSCKDNDIVDKEYSHSEIIKGYQPLYTLLESDNLEYLYDYEGDFYDLHSQQDTRGLEGIYAISSSFSEYDNIEDTIVVHTTAYYNQLKDIMRGTAFVGTLNPGKSSEDLDREVTYTELITSEKGFEGEIVLEKGKSVEDPLYYILGIPEEMMIHYETYTPIYEIIEIDVEYLESLEINYAEYEPENSSFATSYNLKVDDKNVQAILKAYPNIDLEKVTQIRLDMSATGQIDGPFYDMEIRIIMHTEDGSYFCDLTMFYTIEENRIKYFVEQ